VLEVLDGVDRSSPGNAYGAAGDVPQQIRALRSPGESTRRQALHEPFGDVAPDPET
jgi:hypothetical protein